MKNYSLYVTKVTVPMNKQEWKKKNHNNIYLDQSYRIDDLAKSKVEMEISYDLMKFYLDP